MISRRLIEFLTALQIDAHLFFIFGPYMDQFIEFDILELKQYYILLCTNISSVMEFKRWWVLKSKLFGQESTCHLGKIFKKFLQVMTVCQKLGLILESKVVQKLSLENFFLTNSGLLN